MPAENPSAAENPREPLPNEEEFAGLFTRHHRTLFGYLVTTLGSTADVEDVFQETCMVLWRDRSQYQPGTNFINWALTIAQNRVHQFRRQRQRTLLLPSDALLDQIAVESIHSQGAAEQRRSALVKCLERLSRSDRDLVSAAYAVGRSLKDAAEELGRPVNTVYKALNRIRRKLLECIERRLAAEER